MPDSSVLDAFTAAAESWVCDGYYVDIRYLASSGPAGGQILDARILLSPLPPALDVSFTLDIAGFVVGQTQLSRVAKSAAIALLREALGGTVNSPAGELRLVANESLDYYSELVHRNRWFSDLHVQVLGSRRPLPTPIELSVFDNALRASTPPFDGLADVVAWLGLSSPDAMPTSPSISLRVSPPVDLIFDQCALADDELSLTFHAHPKFDVDRMVVSVRAVPGVGLAARRQIGAKVKWGRPSKGRKTGKVKVKLDHADSALVMLLIEGASVRRQWFIDPGKARNNRLATMQHYDKDLRKVRDAVLEASDGTKFENGIAALLFLLGFTPALQIETDAPDIVVTTPGGRLAIVECTTRIADFASKLGKLVDRRGSLTKSLSATGHSSQVAAVLVCRQSRDRIAAQEKELRAHRVILVTEEELRDGLDRVRTPGDPDQMLEAAVLRLEQVFGE